jgi:hypothetical protein
MKTIGQRKNHLMLNLDRLKALAAYGELTESELNILDTEVNNLYEKHVSKPTPGAAHE